MKGRENGKRKIKNKKIQGKEQEKRGRNQKWKEQERRKGKNKKRECEITRKERGSKKGEGK